VLDLNDVALFVEVVRSGSFAAAARRLGLPSNTVSRRVQDLETQLGTRLLQRSTRKLTLTTAGEEYHARSVGAVDELLLAGRALSSGGQEPSGLVRAAVPADFFDFFTIQEVAEFLAAFPKVRLAFVLSDGRVDMITERIDVAFRGGRLEDAGYSGRQVVSDGNDNLVASPAYLAARGVPNSLEDLAVHDCITAPPPVTGYVTWRLTRPNGDEAEVRVTGRFSGNTAQAIRKAALAGLGIALLPHTIVKRELDAGSLISILPNYTRPGQGLNVLYPSARQVPLAVSTFVDRVVAALRALHASQ
jgi:DNA-binding transcriptional LysR family regulator